MKAPALALFAVLAALVVPFVAAAGHEVDFAVTDEFKSHQHALCSVCYQVVLNLRVIAAHHERSGPPEGLDHVELICHNYKDIFPALTSAVSCHSLMEELASSTPTDLRTKLAKDATRLCTEDVGLPFCSEFPAPRAMRSPTQFDAMPGLEAGPEMTVEDIDGPGYTPPPPGSADLSQEEA